MKRLCLSLAVLLVATDVLAGYTYRFGTVVRGSQGLRTGVEDVDKRMDARAIKGFPLRQVVTHSGSYGSGQSIRWTMETTVADVQQTPIGASQFEAPAGFTRVERPQAP